MRLGRNLAAVARLFVVSLISGARMHLMERLSSLGYTMIIRESVVIGIWINGCWARNIGWVDVQSWGSVFAFRTVEELYRGAAAALRVCEVLLIVLTWLVRGHLSLHGQFKCIE